MGRAKSVYLHVPFCEAKCPYCAFSSDVKRPGDEELYLRCLAREMSLKACAVSEADTFYIGGGTPSVLSPDGWRKLTDLIEKYFSFSKGAEVTAEANPSSMKPEHLSIWRDWRVSRVSIGVQSFDDRRLEFLGRVHSAEQAGSAVNSCLGMGFSVSLDLMFGLPGESTRDWGLDLRAASALKPHHISIYQLTVEPETRFAEKNFRLPDGYAQYRYAQWALPRAGYEQYEVASFSVPGHESRHNLNYWGDGEYLGLGPSAWSCLGGSRSKNAASLGEYAASDAGSRPEFSERPAP
ncbi:MAG: radical SAM family heme chaperone HemW, partial [Synergistaceae bacterium]|nr:radical SAM family heme chaperone HemW [Synergistaceae bacterium]